MTDHDLIDSYGRAQALADGVLVDVTRQASPAEMRGGFRVPVAVTAALQSAIESIPKRLDGIVDVRGRLHDVLWLAAAASRARPTGFTYLAVVMPRRGGGCRTLLRLAVAIGPGDAGEPVVTIGFPEDF